MVMNFRYFTGLTVSLLLVGGCAERVVDQEGPVVGPVKDVGREEAKPGPPEERKETPSKPRGVITEVDLNRVLQLQDAGTALLIDVRPGLFYGLGHMPGAIHMAKKSFPLSLIKRQEAIDTAVAAGKILVLYCTNLDCPDGYAVGKEMAEMGYSVSIYKGGWEEWKAAGF